MDPYRAPDSVLGPSELLQRWARELGLSKQRARPIERYPSPPAWIVTRVARSLGDLRMGRGRPPEVIAPASRPAVLDAWRIEAAMLGLSLVALHESDPEDGLGLAVCVGQRAALFQVVSTAAAWAHGLAAPEAAASPDARLALALARRVADDQGGRLEIAVDPGFGAAARLHLPLDPEQPCREGAPASEAVTVPFRTPAYADVRSASLARHEAPRGRSRSGHGPCDAGFLRGPEEPEPRPGSPTGSSMGGSGPRGSRPTGGWNGTDGGLDEWIDPGRR